MANDTPAPQAASDLPTESAQPAAPHDSAPPPAEPASAVSTVPPPTRDYMNHPAPVPQLPPAYAPNSSIPQFIRTLAFVVFVVGGTTSAAMTWFYKSVIYPRLVLALQARTRLHAAHLVSYEALLASLRNLNEAPGFSLLRSPSLIVEGEKETTMEGLSEGNNPGEEKAGVDLEKKDEEGPTSEAIGEDSAAGPPLPAPATVLLPLQTKLAALALVLPPPGSATSLSSNIASPPYPTFAEASTPSEGLLGALSSLNNYIETESYAVVTSAYRSYGASSTTTSSSDRKPLLDAVTNLKAEIRSVKGALLNRRNFAALAPRGEVTA